MAVTSIGDQLTPGRPTEVTFAAETGTPSATQEVLLIGREAATGGSVDVNKVTTIDNAGDLALATVEAELKFGADSELSKMVIAAVEATQGLGTVPTLKAVSLAEAAVDFGPVLTGSANKVKAEFIASPFDGQTDDTNRDTLKDHCLLVSGAQRVENNQFGTIGVVANYSELVAGDLDKADTRFLAAIWHRDSAPTRSVGELAAAAAARMAANGVPFNPLDDQKIGGVDAQADDADVISVGAGLESESALTQGWTPLRTFPNGEVGFVRTITMRRTIKEDGVSPTVTSYFDVQDYQVLYFWRKTVHTRESQDDFKTRKASNEAAQDLRGELVRLMELFQTQDMFQAVSQLAKKLVVQRSTSDRHRFDVKTPVNVIPGLHVIANNVEATTEFDELTL